MLCYVLCLTFFCVFTEVLFSVLLQYRKIIKHAYECPLVLSRNGVKETHRSIVTMWKMDTKEYSPFTYTKQINPLCDYGCSKCCDTRHQLTDPKRKSFQYPRSNNHLLEIAGQDVDHTGSCPLDPGDICEKFQDWDKKIKEESQWICGPTKGQGYKPPILRFISEKMVSDPHHTVTSDLWHAGKNLFQQLFATFMCLQEYGPDDSYGVFLQIKDFMHLNCVAAKLTKEDYKKKPDYISNISLENAPTALVEIKII